MNTEIVDLSSEEIVALVKYYDELYKSITPKMLDQPNDSGGTMRDTAGQYLKKRMYFQQILTTLR